MPVAMEARRLREHVPASDGRPLGRRARRIGLAVFFASVAVNAALGIYAVLAPHFGETQGKVLGTSLCVTGGVLLGLACEPAWERELLHWVPFAAAALGAIAFASAIVLIWVQPHSETWAKTMGTMFTLAVAGTAASLLALAGLAPSHAWVFRVTLALLALGAGIFAITLWLGQPPGWLLRGYGVVMITLAAFAVTVPVLHWMDRGRLAVAEARAAAVRFCPFCGNAVQGAVEAGVTCRRCGRAFRVDPGAMTSYRDAGPEAGIGAWKPRSPVTRR